MLLKRLLLLLLNLMAFRSIRLFYNNIASLTVSSGTEYLSVVCVRGYQLGLYWGRELQRRVFVSKFMSLSIVTALVTIPFIKESAVAKKRLVLWHQKGIQVYIRAINIFLVARFTIYYTKSVIYIISLDIIREPITIIIKLDGVQVHQVILQ